MPDLTHPLPDQLTAFAQGRLPLAGATTVEEHVLACAACTESLLQQPDDALVLLARACGAHGPPEEGPAPGATPGPARAVVAVEAEVPAELTAHPRYRILRLLGRGGMGTVYEAEHRFMERPVALKVIHPRFTANAAAVERFRREVKAAARLHHPHIVTAFDADQAGATHFLVMEYVEGISLARLLRERGPLAVAEACAYARQAALGLQHAHERGMVHRDVKPDNLMRTPEGVVKVLDFGLAALVCAAAPEGPCPGDGGGAAAAGERLTGAGAVLGTPDYIAPEQAEDARSADIRADIYSLGCTLYQLLTGRPPFEAASPREKLRAHRAQTPTPAGRLRPDLPPALGEVLGRMMGKDPAGRYQTPAEAAAALAPFADGPAPERPPAGEHRGPWALLLALLLPGLAAGALLSHDLPPGGPPAFPGEGRDDKALDRPAPQPARAAAGVERLAGELHRVRWPAGQAWMSEVAADGSAFLVTGQPDTTRVWDGRTGQLRYTLPGGVARFSPDGRSVITGSAGQFRIHDAVTGELQRRFANSLRGGFEMAQAPDGRRLVVSQEDGEALWDVARGVELRRWPRRAAGGHASWAFTADGTRFFLRAPDERAYRVLDLEARREIRAFERLVGRDGILRLLPGDRQALVRDGGRAWLLDVASGRKLRERLPYPGDLTADYADVGVPQDLRVFRDGTLASLDAATGAERARFRTHIPEGDAVSLVVRSPDRKAVLLASARVIAFCRLPGASEGAKTGEAWWALVPAPVTHLAVSPDGRHAVASAWDGVVRIWDAAEGQLVHRLAGGYAAFTPDGKRVVAMSQGAFRIYDVSTGRPLDAFGGHPAPLWDMALAPDGKRAVVRTDRTFHLWDLGKKAELRRWDFAGSFAWKFSPDGKHLLTRAAPSEERFRVWDVEANREVGALAHLVKVKAIHAWLAGGRQALVSDGPKLWVMDVTSGKEVPGPAPAAYPGGGVLSPDGRHYLCHYTDDTVRLLDSVSLAEKARLRVHLPEGEEGIQQSLLSLSPDGRHLTLGTRRGLVLLCRLPHPAHARENP